MPGRYAHRHTTLCSFRKPVPISGIVLLTAHRGPSDLSSLRCFFFFRDAAAPRDYIRHHDDHDRDDFSLLDDWEDRYRYVIELGEALPPVPDQQRNAANKVPGCVSQVWLTTEHGSGANPVITFTGDSDAHIVRGLVAIMLALFSGQTASKILETDAEATLKTLGLDEHLSPQRANGLRSMVKRIKRDAEAALKQTA